MKPVQFSKIADLYSVECLITIFSELKSVKVLPFDSGGFSSSTLESIQLTFNDNSTKKLVFKKTDVSKDWFNVRTKGRAGREIDIFTDSMFDEIWEIFHSPYVAFAEEGNEIGILMQDLSQHLFPNERKPIKEETEEMIISKLAKLHSVYWKSDVLEKFKGLLKPKDYLFMMGPQDHSMFDKIAKPPENIEGWMNEGWEYALNHLPKNIIDYLMQPLENITSDWDDIPFTLIHGDTKLANIAILNNSKVSIFDWAFVGLAPCTFDLCWYLAVNASRLSKRKEELIKFYRNELEIHLEEKIEEETWERLLNAGITCGFFMLFWTKAFALKNEREGAKHEWDWWVIRMSSII